MTLTYKNGNIHVTDQGAGTAVVLLHGFLESSRMWQQLEPTLAKTNRVVAIDLLGHGQTSCFGYVHTMEMMAEAVRFVMAELNIPRATFIGHSMGGYVALAMADLYPELVTGLCLMNSTASPDSEARKKHRDLAIKAVKQNATAFIRMSVANLFAEHNRERLQPRIEEEKDAALKTPLQGIVAALEGMKTRKGRTRILHSAHFKKLMVIGKNDPILEAAVLIAQAQETETQWVMLEGGHMSHIENFQELDYNIMHFIEK